jgi:hypothetical protein
VHTDGTPEGELLLFIEIPLVSHTFASLPLFLVFGVKSFSFLSQYEVARRLPWSREEEKLTSLKPGVLSNLTGSKPMQYDA